MATQDSFGPDLRSERERRGITLEAIAQSTKFRPSLLAALERGDLSKLPGGIFRKALLRGYAAAVGLPPEPLLARFLTESVASSDLESASGGMRLTLEPDSRWNTRSVGRMLAAIADMCAVLLLAGVIAQFTGTNHWATAGAIGLIYYALTTALLGQSPASWYLTTAAFRHQRKGLLRGRQRASLTSSEPAAVQSHPARL